MPRSAIRLTIGLLLAIAAIVALAPASIVDAALDARTQGAWRLADARGPWWRGGGVLSSGDGRARMPIAWRITLLPLARGVLSIDLDPDGGSARGTIALRPGALSLHDLQLRVPATFVAALAPRAAVPAVGGTLELRAGAFEWTPTGGSGGVDAQWQDARLVVADATVELGAVSLALAPRQGRLEGTVRNSGGEIAVDGTIAGTAASIDAAVTLRPLPSTPEALRRSLPMLGPQDATGAVHIDLHGRR